MTSWTRGSSNAMITPTCKVYFAFVVLRSLANCWKLAALRLRVCGGLCTWLEINFLIPSFSELVAVGPTRDLNTSVGLAVMLLTGWSMENFKLVSDSRMMMLV